MRRAWRIVKETHATTAFDGEGAWLFGGRWNSRGTRVVYASATRSLAALETLVHLNPPMRVRFVARSIEFDDQLVEVATGLPADWKEEPPPPSTKRIGDRWALEARTAVFEMPSALIPEESNYLLNPAHPDFKSIVLGAPELFSFDPRLLGS
jgi:RES domain-containing protein